MKRIFLLISFFFSILIIGQRQLPFKKEQDKNTKNEISISIPKEVQIKNISAIKEDNLDKKMPWIIALVIGVLSAGVNFWISHRLRQSNERNLQRQVESAQKMTLTQFKATIATKNRQDWINELRHELSELLTSTTRVTGIGPKNEDYEKHIDKILFTKSKIQLMLNYEKIEQKKLIDSIENLFDKHIESDGKIDDDDFAELRSSIISDARVLFDIHWKKIKNLQ
ncbi:hypothetical protein [Flavobacterium sp. CF136]|uniref:hypothetical protein n=1 Tax=Flavobacterium sp. (strain CF136) TaxID=1144313 RepID=UPI0002717C86|nr:hypothetical protein [Flavobacterium sp. CF136]EJL63051.1 hypothetical protein PMI10_02677 [Flavobacterium sp. CF136]